MTLHLFDNYAAVWTSTADTAVETGNRFAVANDASLDELLWYRRDTTAGHKPEVLRCWDLSTHAVIAQAVSIPDTGDVGWQTTPAPGGITLLPGHLYCVTAYWPDATTASNRGLTSAPIAGIPAPLSGSGNTRGYHGATLGEPTSSDSAFAEATDVGITDLGPGAGSGSTTLTGDLNAWLNTSSPPNTHTGDGLPSRTDANVTIVKGEAEGVNGFAAIKAVADAIASSVAGLPGTIAGAVTTITGQITAMSANIFDHAVTGLTAISGDVRSVENHALDVLAGMVTFPGTSPHYAWTAGDPIGFDQCVVVAVPAEAYHLEILSHPRHPLNQVCGVNIIYRSGWWCELSGEIGAERHYIDFEKTLLRDGARRLPGILVSLEPGFSGVVTPYTLEAV